MKLLQRTSLYYSIVLVFALAIGIFLIFIGVRSVIIEELDEYLLFEKHQLLEQFGQLKDVPFDKINLGDQAFIRPINKVTFHGDDFKDTIMYDHYEGHPEPYRELSFQTHYLGRSYKVNIFKSLIKPVDLIRGIVKSIIWVVLVLLVGLFLLNRWISKRIWKPFYSTLDQMKSFEISKSQKLEVIGTNTKEFKELNEGLIWMTSRIANEYQTLKEFTENAAHEMQTPLSVIKAKIEILIQEENLDQKEMDLIQSVYEAASKLSWLNRSLLLLSKIENRQYLSKESIPVADLVQEKLYDLEEYSQSKNLKIQLIIKSNPEIEMDANLAEILFANLINNAIKHNIENGSVTIELSSDSFTILNSGKPPTVGTEKLFNRFQKGNNTDSLGIGLAIVKAICDYYNYPLNYYYHQDLHKIEIRFK